ncbi:hypothetical protein EG68_01347 [Paragonimus skrjabini miyazakii]|uniref:Uncharacterized protein n=1 Tax=Paragonimus skrjabini miyazakii TaxID=59628 RepID=A0A8S9Z196_9TREM|nr:hypothetical protein EG68_01347 [Paragonimus skrjabini miyazakii]
MNECAKLNITSLSYEELQVHIANCLRLQKTLGSQLRDGGKNLERLLERLQNALPSRLQECSTVCERSQIPCMNSRRTTPVLSSNLSGFQPVYSGDNLPEGACSVRSSSAPYVPESEELVEQFASIKLGSGSLDPKETEEDISRLPTLTLKEAADIHCALNLVPLTPSSFRWYVFVFEFVDSLVYLVVYDCAALNRHLFRVGLQATWFPQTRVDTAVKSDAKNRTNTGLHDRLYTPAETVKDLWDFVTTSIGANSNNSASTPCLICCSNPGKVNDLIWCSRLLRATRHFSSTRMFIPRDCRFVDVMHSSNRPREMVAPDPDLRTALIHECRTITNETFTRDQQGCLSLRHFSSVKDFFRKSITKNLPWMEAPLELHLLRQIKSNGLIYRSHSSFNSGTIPILDNVPDQILRRLAATGLGRTRLTRLAELFGWHGFAGLLSFRIPTTCELGEIPIADFVTDNLTIIQDLYRFFKHVYRRLDRHLQLHTDRVGDRETRKQKYFSVSNVQHPVEGYIPDKIQAWTSSGCGVFDSTEVRYLRALDMRSSIELMQKVQKNYEETIITRSLPVYQSFPPSTADLRSFRISSVNSPDDEVDGSSDDSHSSLGLEDVD